MKFILKINWNLNEILAQSMEHNRVSVNIKQWWSAHSPAAFMLQGTYTERKNLSWTVNDSFPWTCAFKKWNVYSNEVTDILSIFKDI